MGWLIYFGVVLAASLMLGWHLGRFRAACTEMTGMMAGMTIGMLGGFALGYGMAAAAGRDLFLGNLVGVILGAVLGGWFGRAGGLMGIMDGATGGVMGGSMGAMIAAMIYPDWKLQWTGMLFGGVYVVGALALTVLIESRTPDHGHLHWLLPKLTLVRSTERMHTAKSGSRRAGNPAGATSREGTHTVASASTRGAPAATALVRESAPVARPIRDYYSMLKVEKSAGVETLEEAYLDLLATADQETVERADRALLTLRDPQRRARYDAALAESLKRQSPSASPASAPSDKAEPVAASERGDCCPPPKKKSTPPQTVTTAGAARGVRTVSTPSARPAVVTAVTAAAVAPSAPVAKSLAPVPARGQTAPIPAPRNTGNATVVSAAIPARAGHVNASSPSSNSTSKQMNGKNGKHGKHAKQAAQQAAHKGTAGQHKPYNRTAGARPPASTAWWVRRAGQNRQADHGGSDNGRGGHPARILVGILGGRWR